MGRLKFDFREYPTEDHLDPTTIQNRSALIKAIPDQAQDALGRALLEARLVEIETLVKNSKAFNPNGQEDPTESIDGYSLPWEYAVIKAVLENQ